VRRVFQSGRNFIKNEIIDGGILKNDCFTPGMVVLSGRSGAKNPKKF
jgi:hypothetical protein